MSLFFIQIVLRDTTGRRGHFASEGCHLGDLLFRFSLLLCFQSVSACCELFSVFLCMSWTNYGFSIAIDSCAVDFLPPKIHFPRPKNKNGSFRERIISDFLMLSNSSRAKGPISVSKFDMDLVGDRGNSILVRKVCVS